ncbi:MAG TPA: type II secretion system protein GspG [Polyangia bacterium]|nr:type II secretion system protein GspG [Polyangia bacterium]
MQMTFCARRTATCDANGFTLIEIMVVLAIIGLITAAIGVAIYKKYRDAQIKVTQMQVQHLVADVSQYLIMKNRCPTAEDLLAEQYVTQSPRDAWGTAIVIKCPGDHEPDPADAISWGPDKKPDTADDIKSWVH